MDNLSAVPAPTGSLLVTPPTLPELGAQAGVRAVPDGAPVPINDATLSRAIGVPAAQATRTARALEEDSTVLEAAGAAIGSEALHQRLTLLQPAHHRT